MPPYVLWMQNERCNNMNKSFALLFLLSLFLSAHAQTVKSDDAKVHTIKVRKNADTTVSVSEIFSYVEQMPSFPGGMNAMMKYINTNLTYPEKAKENSIQGTVNLSFIVNVNGEIKEVKVLKGIKGYPELEQEAIRLISSMPLWIPGKNKGVAVAVQYQLPMKFSLK